MLKQYFKIAIFLSGTLFSTIPVNASTNSCNYEQVNILSLKVLIHKKVYRTDRWELQTIAQDNQVSYSDIVNDPILARKGFVKVKIEKSNLHPYTKINNQLAYDKLRWNIIDSDKKNYYVAINDTSSKCALYFKDVEADSNCPPINMEHYRTTPFASENNSWCKYSDQMVMARFVECKSKKLINNSLTDAPDQIICQ